jgi:hypothetical protein
VCHPETIRRCCPCYSAKMFFAARNNLNPSALARSSILGSYSPLNSRDRKPRARPCTIANLSRGLRSRYSPKSAEGAFSEVLRSKTIRLSFMFAIYLQITTFLK